MLRDLLDDPARYAEGVAPLLQQLVNGKPLAELSKRDIDLLNDATLTMSSAKAPTKTVAKVAPKRLAAQLPRRAAQARELDLPTAPTFWWRTTAR